MIDTAAIEEHLAWEASKHGLLVIEQTGEAGWPRWLVIGDTNVHGFLAVASPSALSELQLSRIDSLVRLGHLVRCTDTKRGVDAFVDSLVLRRKFNGVVGQLHP